MPHPYNPWNITDQYKKYQHGSGTSSLNQALDCIGSIYIIATNLHAFLDVHNLQCNLFLNSLILNCPIMQYLGEKFKQK